jgi:hypothetical protein
LSHEPIRIEGLVTGYLPMPRAALVKKRKKRKEKKPVLKIMEFHRKG